MPFWPSVDYTSDRLVWRCFSRFPYPERLRRPRTGQTWLFQVQKNEALGIIDILIACDAAVDGLEQQVRRRELRVLPLS